MEKERKSIEKIIFNYVEGVRKDIDREVAATNNVNMWFGPIVEELNKQSVELLITFDDDQNHIHFKNISSELRKTANERFNLFRTDKFGMD